MLGFIANTLLLLCAAFVHRCRWALLCGAAGGVLWAFMAYRAGWWNLVFIELVLASLQIRGYTKCNR